MAVETDAIKTELTFQKERLANLATDRAKMVASVDAQINLVESIVRSLEDRLLKIEGFTDSKVDWKSEIQKILKTHPKFSCTDIKKTIDESYPSNLVITYNTIKSYVEDLVNENLIYQVNKEQKRNRLYSLVELGKAVSENEFESDSNVVKISNFGA